MAKRLVLANLNVVIPVKDVTPIGVNLIPTLSSMNSVNGIVTGDSPTNSTYHVKYDGSAKSNLSLYGYKMFNPVNSGTTFETKVYHGSDVTYTLHSSQYNEGFFDPGEYKFFTSYYNRKIANNCYIEFLFYVKNENNEWIQIAHYGYTYPNTPATAEVVFRVTYKFKGIRMYKINSKNYDHTRNYQRYNTNLIRLSK